MAQLQWEFDTPSGLVHVVSTGRSDGDFGLDAVDAERRAVIHPAPWTWLRQVHGDAVVVAGKPGECAGTEADAAVTLATDTPVAILTADCAPVVLVADGGVAVVHAGWRGLVAGVVGAAAERLARLGATPVASLLGPCIHPARYEFGEVDLARVVDRFGSRAQGTTLDGRPALDMPRTVAAACEAAGWPAPDAGPCTSDEAYFSHRTRGDLGRQTTVAWIER